MQDHPHPDRRTLLQTLLGMAAAPLVLRHARASGSADREQRFGLGLASGCPRPDGMVLWTRLTGADLPDRVAVDWEVAHDEGFRRMAARGRYEARAEDAHSVHAEPAGLAPERWYWYRFTALGQRSRPGRTRSAPAPGAAVQRLRFAIASCQHIEAGHYAAWGDLARQDLDLLLFLGDYIYEGGANPGAPEARRHRGGECRTLADYRQRHAQYRADPQLQQAHAVMPWIVTWDDHEVANDWAGPLPETPEPDFAARRAAAAKAYWEHMPLPLARRPRGPRMLMHAHYDWGRLARIITLDDRQFRDPQPCQPPGRAGSTHIDLQRCPALRDAERSLLGADQEGWLAASWDRHRPWNLLAQQTLMAKMSWQFEPGGPQRLWTDGWDGYAGARTRLLDDLAASGASNAVVLGGDVHANYVAEIKRDFDDPASPVLASEFCGTSISSRGWNQAAIDGNLARNPHLLYGRDERGSQCFELRAGRLEMQARTVREIWNPDSPIDVTARFVVEAGRPGPQRAS